MAERVLGPTGSKRRRRFLLVPLLLICIGLFFVAGGSASLPAGSTGSPNDVGLFQLDANTLPATCASPFPALTPSGGDDWAALWSQSPFNPGPPAGTDTTPCGSDGYTFVADGGTNDHSFWSQGGSKDQYDPALGPWLWSPSDVSPDKNDIQNAFAAIYHTTDNSTPAKTLKFLYFGSDRLDTSGDAQQGFQFLQNNACLQPASGGTAANGNPCPAGVSAHPTGCSPAFPANKTNAGYFVDPATGCPVHHRNGDLLVIVNFNNGGGIGNSAVYEWFGATAAANGSGCYGTPPSAGPPATAGICTQPVLFGSGADCTLISGANDFCSTANKNALPGEPVWPYTNKDAGHSYEISSFVEAGINLSHIQGAGQCFPTFLAETRSSSGPGTGTGLTAQLKDLAMGQFQLCKPGITITPNAVNKVGDTHTFTVHVFNTAGGTTTDIAGAHPAVTLTAAGGAVVSGKVDNCATTGTDANGLCTVTFTSNSAGTVTGHATATVTIDGAQFSVATDGTAPNSGDAVKRFVDASVSVTPNGVNGVGTSHVFTLSTTASNAGTTASLTSLTPTITAPAGFVSGTDYTVSDTCSNPTGSGAGPRTCTVTVNSSKAGIFTAHAVAVWHFVDGDAGANPATADVTRATDGTHGSSNDVTKRFVDALVSITPNGVNGVGSSHVFTLSTTASPAGTTPSLTSLTPTITAPAGFVLGTDYTVSNTCAIANVTGSGAGPRTCTVTVNSSKAGVFTAHAVAVWHFVDGDAGANPATADVTRATDGTHGSSNDATKRFVDALVSITPNGVNEVNHAHTFTISTTASPAGTTASLTSLTPSITAPAGFVLNTDYTVSDTCAIANVTGSGAGPRTCTVTVNSTKPGVFTAHAVAVWHFVDGDANANPATVDLTRATDSTHGSSGDATKRFVDLRISIGPAEATNTVGDPHTFTVTVQQNDGLPANASSTGPTDPNGDGTTGFGPVADGTQVSVNLADSDGALHTLTGTGDLCANPGTSGGTCTVTFTSATSGTVTGNATVGPYSVGGVPLTRDTLASTANIPCGDNQQTCGPAVKHFIAGSISWTKVDNANRLQGGATFALCKTANFILPSGPFADINPPDCSFGPVPDNTGQPGYTGPDTDPTPGAFSVIGLSLGRYTVHEIIAPPGYLPDPRTETVELTPNDPGPPFVNHTDAVIALPFVNSRPILKITGFGYTNAPDPADGSGQPDGIFKGITTYKVTLHNYGTAAAVLDASSLKITSGNSNLTCDGTQDGGLTLPITGTIAVGADSSAYTLTCHYDHPVPTKIDATLVVKYTTNGLTRDASGSPATISYTVNPN